MTADRERLIRRAYRAFADRDVDGLTALADERIEISTVTGLLAGRTEPYRGHQGLADYLGDLAGTWKRLELQPQDFHAVDEQRVLVFGRVRAWHNEGLLDTSNAWLWTLEGRRVRAVQVFADPTEARRAFTEAA